MTAVGRNVLSRRDVAWGVGLTLAIEAITCVGRFYLGLQATQDTAFLASVTFGLRIHHAYLGILLIGLTFLTRNNAFRRWGLRIGASLILSDLVHHFIVLWAVTGNPEIDLTCGHHLLPAE